MIVIQPNGKITSSATTDCGMDIKTIKKQAVKEFGERLKKSKDTICIGGRIFIEVVAVKAIDNLITELYGAEEE